MKESFPLVAVAACAVVLAALLLPAGAETSSSSRARRTSPEPRLAALERRVLLLENNLKQAQAALAARGIHIGLATPSGSDRHAALETRETAPPPVLPTELVW